jgi:6-phosphogluconolactonase
MAVSGGNTPREMFAVLAREEVPWERVELYQVDERIAPHGDADRNFAHLRESLGTAPVQIVAMPVEGDDLAAAAESYASELPASFELVHLGLGADGHTASLIPGDPVLDEHDRLVALTGEYQGRRRMTLTYPALERAREVLWLVTGADKREALTALLGGDETIPAGRVRARSSVVMADAAAVGRSPG